MRKFKYIGTEEQASDYAIGGKFFPKVGEIYEENVNFGGSTVAYWVEEVNFTIDEWEEVFDEQVISNTFSNKVDKVLNNIREVLITKNEKYGDSALNPVRIFSTVDSTEQIKVRIDDKLSRIKNYDGNLEDEDVITDLIGYLVLLKISLNG